MELLIELLSRVAAADDELAAGARRFNDELILLLEVLLREDVADAELAGRARRSDEEVAERARIGGVGEPGGDGDAEVRLEVGRVESCITIKSQRRRK